MPKLIASGQYVIAPQNTYELISNPYINKENYFLIFS